ncbi:MAG: hypothetical protein CMK59_07240 [Proteobacteria bacterium]|nr:hypothetical protein [Pseudomonadota bacterium]
MYWLKKKNYGSVILPLLWILNSCAVFPSSELNDINTESKLDTDPVDSTDQDTSPTDSDTEDDDTSSHSDTNDNINNDIEDEIDSGQNEENSTETEETANSNDLSNYSISLSTSSQIDMILIPSGVDPLGRYTLNQSYFVMSTEITQDMYFSIKGFQAYEGESTLDAIGDTHPAYYISWDMGADFANTLTQHHNNMNSTNLTECYSCSGAGTSVVCTATTNPYECTGYRFLTEAEWEYAARSGTTGDFWTGNGLSSGGMYSADECSSSITIEDGLNNPLLGDFAWFCGNSNGSSMPVAQKRPNGFGLYDMHGNVWEWTADNGSFTSGCVFPESNIDPYCTNGSNRVMRGGYWNKRPDFLTANYTVSGSPSSRNKFIGARLARSAITSNGDYICADTCQYAIDFECDDGGINSMYSLCEFGTDCSDCGVRSSCDDSCSDANNGICDDGGPNDPTPSSSLCSSGTDCSDCGSYSLDDAQQ